MRRSLRIVCWILLVAALVVVVLWATHRRQVRAYLRVAVVASTMADVPVPRGLTQAMTREPVPLEVRSVGGLDAAAVRPGGDADERHPTVVLLVPRDTGTAELDDIAHLQSAMARSGLTTWAIRLPPIAAFEPGTRAPGDAVVDALREIAGHRNTRAGGIGLIGAGPGASLAIIAAADPALRSQVRAVVAIQPYADVQGVLRLVVTGTTRDADGRDTAHRAGARLQRLAANATVSALEQAGLNRQIGRVLRAAIDVAETPLDPLLTVPARLLPSQLQPVRDLLGADDPESFDRAWNELPASLTALAAERSPLEVVDQVEAPITYIVPVDDSLLPAADARRLHHQTRHGQLVVTPLLDPAGDVDPTRERLRPLLRAAVRLLEQVD